MARESRLPLDLSERLLSCGGLRHQTHRVVCRSSLGWYLSCLSARAGSPIESRGVARIIVSGDWNVLAGSRLLTYRRPRVPGGRGNGLQREVIRTLRDPRRQTSEMA